MNGERDRPDALASLAEKLHESKISRRIVALKDTPHNLGLYYQRAGKEMARFLGSRLGK